MRTWSGYVSSTKRMSYNQYIIGTLFCEQVEFVKDVDFNEKRYHYDSIFFQNQNSQSSY